MMDEFENLDDFERADKEDIFSKSVRAGKRTYFFDVKSTRNSDFYLTVTESKKRVGRDGRMNYEKHKIFLYKEDFEKFLEGLNDVIDYIKANQEVIPRSEPAEHDDTVLSTPEFSSVSFDDLEK